MSITSISTSESLVGGLCRELQYLQERYKSLTALINNSNDQILKTRFRNEILGLIKRRNEIQNISSALKENTNIDKLSILFLIEIGNRALI
tara:strand:- start:1425 stop:1697 length:273 start_codon:yes stop_codon:yes gene_type:complete